MMNLLQKANLSVFLMSLVMASFLLGMAYVFTTDTPEPMIAIPSLIGGAGVLINGIMTLIWGGRHQRKICKTDAQRHQFKEELNSSDTLHFRGLIFLKSWLIIKGYYRVSIIRYEDIIEYYKIASYEGKWRVLFLSPLHYIFIETNTWCYKAPYSVKKDGDINLILDILAKRSKNAREAIGNTQDTCSGDDYFKKEDTQKLEQVKDTQSLEQDEDTQSPRTAKDDLKAENEAMCVAKTLGAFILLVPTLILIVKWYSSQDNLILLSVGIIFILLTAMVLINALRHLSGDKDERAIKRDNRIRVKFELELVSNDAVIFPNFILLRSWLVIKDMFRTYIVKYDDIVECYERTNGKSRYIVIKTKYELHNLIHGKNDGDINRIFEVLKEKLDHAGVTIRWHAGDDDTQRLEQDDDTQNLRTAKDALKWENKAVCINKTIGAIFLLIPAVIMAVKWYSNQGNLILLSVGIISFLLSIIVFINAFSHLGGDKDERTIKKDDRIRAKFEQELVSNDAVFFFNLILLKSWLIITFNLWTYIVNYDDIVECYVERYKKDSYISIKTKDKLHEVLHRKNDGDISHIFEVLQEKLKHTNAVIRYEGTCGGESKE